MHILRSSLINALWRTRKSLGKTCLFMFSLKTRELIWTRMRKGSKWNRTVESNCRGHDETQLMRHQMIKLIKFCYGGKTNYCYICERSIWINTIVSAFFLKCERDSTKHCYGPDVCNVLAYIWVLEIWPLVQALSWEAPLRERVYFQCVYLYSSCLNRGKKKRDLPGNQARKQSAWMDQIPIFTSVNVSWHNNPLPKSMQCNAACCACVWRQVGILCWFVRRLLQFYTLWFDPYSYKKYWLKI